MNIFEISEHSPVPFYEYPGTSGSHYGQVLFSQLLKPWQQPKYYNQKWQNDDEIRIPSFCSFVPSLKLYTCDDVLVKSVNGTVVVPSPGLDYNAYEMVMTLEDVDEGEYYFIAEATFLDVTLKFRSEPQEIKELHPDTLLFKYTNSKNDFGIVFTGVGYTYEPSFRCEADIPPHKLKPKRQRTSYRDQILNTKTLSATPYRALKLIVGGPWGVAPWVVDLLNRIFCCDHVLINDKQFETNEGSEIETNEFEDHPLVGGSIDLLEAQNRSSKQLSTDALPDGSASLVYDFETSALGPINGSADTTTGQIEAIDP